MTKTPGAVVRGNVRDMGKTSVPGATVALVPDEPRREITTLYRFNTTDVDGNFELRGVAPGSYHLYAFLDLDGAGYLNAEFLKNFAGSSKQIRIDGTQPLSIDLTAY